MTEDYWSVTVFKCKSEKAKDILVDFYDFAKGIRAVKDLHFLIRDRLDDDVVFSFRVLEEKKDKEIINSKIAYKLKSLIPKDDFFIDPDSEHPLYKYHAWPWRDSIKKSGSKKFAVYCKLLSHLSKIVVDMAKKEYFSSEERVELAHVFSWMLGCTEYGQLSKDEFQIGYYDRIEHKYQTHLEYRFQKFKDSQRTSK